MRRTFLVAAAAGLLAACRIFVDLDGLAGGGAADAGAEATSPEGSTPPPPPPPSDAGDAGVSTFCGSVDASLFCDSFDLGDTTFAAWSYVEKTNGGVVALDTTNPKSAPGFLRASSSGGDASSYAVATVNRFLPAARSSLTVGADVRVTASPTTAGVELLEMYDGKGWGCYVKLDVGGGLRMVEEYVGTDGGGQSKSTTITAGLSVDVWRHVSISMSFAQGTFTVLVEGQPMTAGTFAAAPPAPTLRLTAGISYTSSAASGAVIDMDNFTAGD